METLLLRVVSLHGEVFNSRIKNVILPGSEGEFGVYPRHSSLISELKPGIITITKEDDSIEAVIINWGHVKVDEHKVEIIIDDAVALDKTSESSIALSIEKSKELIHKALPNDVMMASISARVETIAKDII